jgi:ribosomal-protein-alanine N-acetyltransferase
MNYFNQETERLQLRKLTIDDVEAWTPFFINNELLKFVGVDMSKDPKTLATDWINRQMQRYEDEGFGHLALLEKATDQLIGVSGIIPRQVDGKTEFEISYSLKQEFWGKGFASEVSAKLKQFGLANNISKRFVSIIDKENTASINVAKKNGMTVLYETVYLGMDVFVYGFDNS